jgi:hypothetical protein
MAMVFGDLRDEDAVREAMKDSETVFHLRALIAMPYGPNPVSDFASRSFKIFPSKSMSSPVGKTVIRPFG